MSDYLEDIYRKFNESTEEPKGNAFHHEEKSGISFPPPAFLKGDTEFLFEEGGSKALKSSHKYLNYGNDIAGVWKDKGAREAFKNLAKDFSGDNKLEKLRNTHKNIKSPDKGLIKSSKGMKSMGKGIQVLSTTEDLYNFDKALKKGNKSKVIQHGADSFSEMAGWAPHPAVKAFSVGYEAMSFVDKSTDRAISGAAYELIFNEMMGMDETRDKIAQAKAQARSFQIKTIATLDSRCKNLLTEIKEATVIRDGFLGDYWSSKPEKLDEEPPQMKSKNPDLSPLQSTYSDLDQVIDQLMKLESELLLQKESLTEEINLLKAAVTRFRKMKKARAFGLSLTPTGEDNTRKFIRYNGRGDVREEGIVQVDEKMRIIGGTNLKYYKYGEDGALEEQGTFDFNKKGKRVNEKMKSLYIY